MLRICLLVLISITTVLGQASNPIKKLNTPLAWKNLEFEFPNNRLREEAFFYGYYQPNKVIPLDVDITYAGGNGKVRYFVTIPRFGEGVPFSLAEVTRTKRSNGPVLRAYPDYESHSSHGYDCNGITSVFRIAIDECDRLWVLDSGQINFRQFCAPKLIVYDLTSNNEIDRFDFPDFLYKSGQSLLVAPIVDVLDPPPGKCRKTKVYMADSTGNALVVYDSRKRTAWRIENRFTRGDSRFATHTIAGENFQLGDGAFAISLTPKSLNRERFLYFHALASDNEISVPLDAVNDPNVWRGWDRGENLFRILGSRGIQCTQEAISSEGYQFCTYNNPLGIFAWDINTSYERKNRYLVAHNPETLQFVGGLKVVKNKKGEEEVLVISNRLQKYYSNSMNYNDVNFRVQSCRVKDLLTGSDCKSSL